MRRGVLFSIILYLCLGLFVTVAGASGPDASRPDASAAETSGETVPVPESRQQVERRAALLLAAGGDASALLKRARELPTTSVRRSPEESFVERLERTLKGPAGSAQEASVKQLAELKPQEKSNDEPAPEPLAEADALVQQRFDDIEATIRRSGVPETVFLERLDRARRAYAERFEALKSGVAEKPGDGTEKSAAQSLVTRQTPAVLRSSLLPYRPASLPARAPVFEPTVVPPYLDATDPGELPADRSSSPSAPLSQPMLAQAASLGYDYVRIYEFVRNEIELEWSVGSLRGAKGTLAAGRGNTVDQASLLVALLRSSGAAARFVRGVVELDVERLRSDLGLASKSDVPIFLARAGIAHAPVLRGGGLAAVQVEHVWVAARLPYTNYRGAVVDRTGRTWLPLDPSLTRF